MTDPSMFEPVERAFKKVCTYDKVQSAERERWSPEVWRLAEEMGLPWVSIPEIAGGVGGTIVDALQILRIAGRYAAPIPLAETGVLAGWLLAGAGMPIHGEPATIVTPFASDFALRNDRLSGVARNVPWAGQCSEIVALVDVAGSHPVVVRAAVKDVAIESHVNLAGEPRDTVRFDATPVDAAPAADGVTVMTVETRGALSRVALISGALSRLNEMTIHYAGLRRQFGKPIAAFQAVQQHLVHLSQHAAMAVMACDLAGRGAERNDFGVIAAAKVVASRAALAAPEHAHQVHGAIGMTQEFALHQFTRRLWSWADEFGSAGTWSERLGTALIDQGADALYPNIANEFAAIVAPTT